MKRIYLLMILFVALGAANTVQAQSVDLRVRHAIISDTMFYGGTTAHIVQWNFINNGPDALLATDTIVLERAYFTNGNNRLRLNLSSIGGIAVGDSASYRDTIQWTSAPAQNPFNWCDTVAAYRGSTSNMANIIPDPSPSNNVVCKTIPFVMQSSSVANIVAENSMAVYPNPATNNITISYNLNASANNGAIILRNLVGQVVHQEAIADNAKGNRQVTVDVSGLAVGIYTAELNVDGAKAVTKFSVAK